MFVTLPGDAKIAGVASHGRSANAWAVGGLCVIVALAGCSGSPSSTGRPTLSEIPYSAKGCVPPTTATVVRVEVFVDSVEPPCVEVVRSQHLEVVNATSDFPQYARSLVVSLSSFSNVRVGPGATAVFPGTLGSHLRKGSNLLEVSPPSDTVEVWLAR